MYSYKKILAPENLFSQLSLRMVNFHGLSLVHLLPLFYPIFTIHVWIRIHKATEYGSNTDPDPQHWFKQNFEQRFLPYNFELNYLVFVRFFSRAEMYSKESELVIGFFFKKFLTKWHNLPKY